MSKYARMTEDQCFSTYKAYETFVEHEVRAGKLSKEQARSYLNDAKKNYRNQNYNRQVDIINDKN
nr:hypothetical protein 16 [Legionellales bacterium]